jgi:hypothetical protein
MNTVMSITTATVATKNTNDGVTKLELESDTSCKILLGI